MPTMTAIVHLRITQPTHGTTYGPPNIVANITWPDGSNTAMALPHIWSVDMWDWKNGHAPDSLTRVMRDDWNLSIHGTRYVYVSPRDTGTSSNETGRVMVMEVDYDG